MAQAPEFIRSSSNLEERLSFEDPLEADHPHDVIVVTTRRALARIALVGAETGARFERQGLRDDYLEWLLTGRPLFAGAAPLDACLTLENCQRALLVHGLQLALNATPQDVDDCVSGSTD